MSRTQKSRRDLNKEATRAAILAAARTLFASHGYVGTSLDAVVRSARVTTGAVYHHFGDKKELFQAVAESVEIEILKRVAERALAVTDAWQRLLAGVSAMLEICTEPAIRRIVFLDAPNVIGAAKWRAIELRFGYGALHRTFVELQEAGQIRAPAIDIVAPMILGALIEAANSVAIAKHKRVALAAAQETITRFLQCLRSEPPS